MDKQNLEHKKEPPETFLMKRGKNPDRKWTQEILLRYSENKGIKFQEVIWEIMFEAASRIELQTAWQYDKR